MAGGMQVDVVVPTRNRPDDLERMVRSMSALTYRPFRLIVIDQSDDPTVGARIVAGAGRPEFTHIAHPLRGKSLALNDALRMCTGDLVAFTDDDCEVPADWLTVATAAFVGCDAPDLLFGNVVACEHDPVTEFVPAIEFARTRVVRGPLLHSYGLLGMGANMVMRRDRLEALGRFDAELGPGGPLRTGEDCELTYRVLQARGTVVQAADLSVIHHGKRPVAGRVATELINDGFFAVGAGYGKHLRRPDARTVVVVMHELVWIVGLMARAVVTRTRPMHARRLLRFCRGLFEGFRAGPAWGP